MDILGVPPTPIKIPNATMARNIGNNKASRYHLKFTRHLKSNALNASHNPVNQLMIIAAANGPKPPTMVKIPIRLWVV